MKRLLLHNLALKVSAVALAVILWLLVVSKGQTEISLSVPIEYANVPQGFEIARYGEKTATVVVRIHESMGKNLREENVRLYVDVGRAKKGEGVFPLRKDEVKLPFVATVVRIEPSSVKLLFEETVTKRVPVKAVVAGAPEHGYVVMEIRIDPSDVVVEGAQSEVRRIGFVKTEQVDLAGLTEDMHQEVSLDTSGHTVRTKTDKVTMHIRINRRGR